MNRRKFSPEQEKEAWKIAIRNAIQKLNPSGFVEKPGNRFLVMFDRDLTETEREIIKSLRFKKKANAFVYTYNEKAKVKPLCVFEDAQVIALYDNMIVYDKKVNTILLRGLTNLQFKYKTKLRLYEVSYNETKNTDE